jgi:hypothetical protein
MIPRMLSMLRMLFEVGCEHSGTPTPKLPALSVLGLVLQTDWEDPGFRRLASAFVGDPYLTETTPDYVGRAMKSYLRQTRKGRFVELVLVRP